MLNKAMLIGNMGNDIEVKDTNGGKVGKFSLATNKKVKGEDRTVWHNIVVWDDVKIDYLQKYAGSGSMLYIEGEINNRSYEQDGVKKWMSEVIVGRFDSRVQILNSRSGGGEARDPQSQSAKPAASDGDFNDEVPF